MKVLLSSLGLSYGSLLTAIALTQPDHVVVITSAQAKVNLDQVLAAARAHQPNFTVECHLLDDPYADFRGGRRLAAKLASVLIREADCQFIANLAGGTTVMQDAIKCLADSLGASEVAVVDRRPPGEQRESPLVVAELVEVPRAKRESKTSDVKQRDEQER